MCIFFPSLINFTIPLGQFTFDSPNSRYFPTALIISHSASFMFVLYSNSFKNVPLASELDYHDHGHFSFGVQFFQTAGLHPVVYSGVLEQALFSSLLGRIRQSAHCCTFQSASPGV